MRSKKQGGRMEGTKKAAGEAAGKGVYVDAYQKIWR